MRNENLYVEDGYITSISERVQSIQKILFNSDGFLKRQLDSLSKANLLEAMDYLEKEKNQLPHYYGKQIDFVLAEIKYMLSHEDTFSFNFTHTHSLSTLTDEY